MTPVQQLIDKIHSHYSPISQIRDFSFNGQIHRFDQDKKGDKALWVVGFEWEFKSKKYFKAQFGSWKRGDRNEFKSYGEKQSKPFKSTESKATKKIQSQIDLERQRKNRQCRLKWKPVFEKASPEPIHEYLKTKKISQNYSARIDKSGQLLIPAYGKQAQFVGVQKIYKNKESGRFIKRFSTGIEKKGSFGAVPDLKSVLKSPQIFLAEGFATAASVFEATESPCAVSWDCGNLSATIETIKYLNPNCSIIIAADKDESGIGQKKAEKACQDSPGVSYKLPSFQYDSESLSDFNDLHCAEGLEAVQSQLVIKPEDRYPTKPDGFFIWNDDKPRPDFTGFAEYMKGEYHLKAFEHSTFIYDQTHYKPIGKLGLTNIVLQETKSMAKPTQIDGFIKIASGLSYAGNDEENPPEGYLNLKNGILYVKDRKLIPHDPKYFFKYQLDTEFKKKADCPRWLEFLDFIFGGDQELIDLSQEIFGYTLLGGEPFLHKAFVLYGEGRNGKSTFLSVLNQLLGKSNTSSVPISQLDKPFSVVSLDGKLANITGEFTTGIVSSEHFKNAVVGEPLIAAHKGKPEYPLYVKCRFFFATNQLPKFGDASTGLKERLTILPFNQFIEAKDRDPFIAEKLMTELSGILNWSLDGLEKVMERGRFSNPEATKQSLQEFEREADSVIAWCDEYLQFGGPYASTKAVAVNDLFTAYKLDCQNDLKRPVGKMVFARRLSKWIDVEKEGRQIENRVEKVKTTRQKISGYSGLVCVSENFRKPKF